MPSFNLLLVFLVITHLSFCQQIDKIINKNDVERVEKALSSDEMSGRKTFTPGIEKAAGFIAAEFKAAGLSTWNNSESFRQEFKLIRPRLVSLSGTADKLPLSTKNSFVITTLPVLRVNHSSGFEKAKISAGANLYYEANKYIQSKKNLLVLVDTGFTKNFAGLSRFRQQIYQSDYTVAFILTNTDPAEYLIEAVHDITPMNLANVVGIIPGKTKKNEYVIFSGHYDHLGTGMPINNDSIFNGANDDAAGITAVIMLARYFKETANNERTLVFAAFTAEEIGGMGSQYFSRQLDADKAVAMFNIEMIGTDSKWGKNSAYITGYEKTDMGKILEKNLDGTGFSFYPDPYPQQQLFYRSDNATLARLGVPAHTISTSKMDAEKFYHTVDDEAETLDLDNMTMIIKAIALSARTIVNGKDAPSRVDVQQLR
ncbi:MAG: M20/M25/M40 family metallo-hydrolase [Chitinophagaceae bacterium]